MSEIEEVQEHMKADMEAMKDQMAAMMEAMLSMKKIMEVNVAAVDVTSAATEVDPTHPLGLNHVNPLVSDMVGQGGEALGGTGGPHLVRKTSMPSRHMPCLSTIRHLMWRTLPMRMSITPDPDVNRSFLGESFFSFFVDFT